MQSHPPVFNRKVAHLNEPVSRERIGIGKVLPITHKTLESKLLAHISTKVFPLTFQRFYEIITWPLSIGILVVMIFCGFGASPKSSSVSNHGEPLSDVEINSLYDFKH